MNENQVVFDEETLSHNEDNCLQGMLHAEADVNKQNCVNKHDYDEENLSHAEDDYDADDEILDKNEDYNNDEILEKKRNVIPDFFVRIE